MQVQITFRHVLPTWELEEQIHREIEHLRRLSDRRITWCHVVLEQPHPRPGRPLVARVIIQGTWGASPSGRVAMATAEHEHAPGALSRAFEAVAGDLRSAPERRRPPEPRRTARPVPLAAGA